MDLSQYSGDTARPGLAVGRVLNVQLPVPPVQEQKDIALHIENATADIDAVIANTHLFADVVTGKLDVREEVEHCQAKSASKTQ